jgi:sortase A
LLLVGTALGAWCLGVLVEARLAQGLGPPAVSALAGDSHVPEKIPHQTVRVPPEPGTWIARLDALSLQLSTTVLEGSDDGTLDRAAGHIEDTPLPGERGNIGIAGHRDTVFRPLRRARVGDTLDLSTADRVYHYRISRTLVVNPEDVYVLKPTGKPTLTLVTCYPFQFVGHAPRRFVVQAELTSDEARSR